MNNSDIFLICPGGKEITLMGSKGTIFPCKVGDIIFCLNNICRDCYLLQNRMIEEQSNKGSSSLG